MSDTETVRVGDEPAIRVRIMDDGSARDVSGDAVKKVKIKPPTGATLEKTAVFSTKSSHAGDGTDGWIEYQVADGELATAGDWYFAGYVEDSAGRQFESEKQRMVVQAAL